MSFNALSTGVLTVFVGFTGTVALVMQAMASMQASPAQQSSGLLMLGLAMALTTGILSWRSRMPVVTAWSTPGAALVASSAAGLGYAQSCGALAVCGALLLLTALVKPLFAWISRIPSGIASGMLAGVLIKFAIGLFPALQAAPALVAPTLLAFVVAKRYWPRYVLVISFTVAVTALILNPGQTSISAPALQLALPVWTLPEFSWQAALGVGLPLYLVTMASQNIAGLTVLRSAGYHPNAPVAVGLTGLASLLIAPFGAMTVNLAAITAAICASPECDPDPHRRWLGAQGAALTYAVLGLCGASALAYLLLFPTALLQALTGLALLGALTGALSNALSPTDATQRESAVVTLCVTASGLALLGISSAFWGLVAGLLWMAVTRVAR